MVAEAKLHPTFLRASPLIILRTSVVNTILHANQNSRLSIFQIFIKALKQTPNPTPSPFASSTPSFYPSLYLHSIKQLVVYSASLPRSRNTSNSLCVPPTRCSKYPPLPYPPSKSSSPHPVTWVLEPPVSSDLPSPQNAPLKIIMKLRRITNVQCL